MPLTYATLQTQIASFLNRDDLTAQIPTFILLAEAAINRDVDHWQMQKRSEATFNERYEPLPIDFISLDRVSIKGQKQLDLVSQAKMLDYRETNNNTSGEPSVYAISTGQIEFYPTPDGDYDGSIVYRSKVSELSDSITSNWLLAEAPDVYLYGSLLHSAPWLQEDHRLGVWGALYTAGVSKLNERSEDGLYGGTGLTMR